MYFAYCYFIYGCFSLVAPGRGNRGMGRDGRWDPDVRRQLPAVRLLNIENEREIESVNGLSGLFWHQGWIWQCRLRPRVTGVLIDARRRCTEEQGGSYTSLLFLGFRWLAKVVVSILDIRFNNLCGQGSAFGIGIGLGLGMEGQTKSKRVRVWGLYFLFDGGIEGYGGRRPWCLVAVVAA